jgi:hypothetical protein
MIFNAFRGLARKRQCVPCALCARSPQTRRVSPIVCPAATYRIAAVAHFLLSHFHVDIRISGAILGGPLSMIDRLTARWPRTIDRTLAALASGGPLN